MRPRIGWPLHERPFDIPLHFHDAVMVNLSVASPHRDWESAHIRVANGLTVFRLTRRQRRARSRGCRAVQAPPRARGSCRLYSACGCPVRCLGEPALATSLPLARSTRRRTMMRASGVLIRLLPGILGLLLALGCRPAA